MRKTEYKNFSLRTHQKNSSIERPNVCQFELTFGCGLHCRHCYTDCYNKPTYLEKELNTEEVKCILDKVHGAGVIWLCLSGGDPLVRGDFLEIYTYAKKKGFIISIFTNAFSMTEEVCNYLSNRPPFVVEITLNAVTEVLYEDISGVKGSFSKVMKGLDLIMKAKLPLKIKTQITRDNLAEVHGIKKYVESLGLEFRPDYSLNARLNGDLAPLSLRISPGEVLRLSGGTKTKCLRKDNVEGDDFLFPCAIEGGDGINVDPYGNMFLCDLIREPSYNLLEMDLGYALGESLLSITGRKFTTDSKCNGCESRELCSNCPGRAYLETGDIEAPVEYYCDLVAAMGRRRL